MKLKIRDFLTRYSVKDVPVIDSYGDSHWTRKLVHDPEGELYGSLVGDGVHIPMFDLDMHCELVESSTPGHYHLYINHPILTRKYKKLMKAFLAAGLIEKGWYDLFKKDKMACLRVSRDKPSAKNSRDIKA